MTERKDNKLWKWKVNGAEEITSAARNELRKDYETGETLEHSRTSIK